MPTPKGSPPPAPKSQAAPTTGPPNGVRVVSELDFLLANPRSAEFLATLDDLAGDLRYRARMEYDRYYAREEGKRASAVEWARDLARAADADRANSPVGHHHGSSEAVGAETAVMD